MYKSDSIVNLSKALLDVSSAMPKINKDSTVSMYNSKTGKSREYKHASLSNILETIKPILSTYGVIVLQFPEGADMLTTTVIHADSGEFIESSFCMSSTASDPQSRGSCITYMRRYALASILKLNVDDDDDGARASKKSFDKKESDKKPLMQSELNHYIMVLQMCANIEDLQKEFKRMYAIIKNNHIDSIGAIDKLSIIKDEMKEKLGGV